MLPARIAYFLNLRGPCLAIDTACSASLVAIANACDSLVLGNSDLALAGGVYISDGPDIHLKMSNAGMLSPDGRCYSFDERANGFVLGEGVGVLLLKRLADAERDGDAIRGVIRGWAVNQDGKTNGITAPNQQSQASLEAGLYRKFGIEPADIGLVEAHGTGTKLGDPIEVEALCASFREFTDKSRYSALSSVKSNIGHLATAAGVAGVIKAVLALENECLPPTINYSKLNEHIALEGSPFFVNTRARPWLQDGASRRLAAVSSFGFSGTNAHMVLEGIDEASRALGVGENTPVVLPLSAKSREQLAEYARALAAFLGDKESVVRASLADIAFTFQTGRTAMSHRLAVVGRSADDLRRQLGAFAETGVVQEASSADAEAAPLLDIARRWMAGEVVDWSALPGRGAGRRVHGLPGYPFARERHWIDAAEAAVPPSIRVEAAGTGTADRPFVDLSVWHEAELQGVDWPGQLDAWLGQSTLVVYGSEDLRAAFERLVSQLAVSCGRTADIAYSSPDGADAALARRRPDCLVVLGDGSAACLKTSKVARAVVFATGDVAAAEVLGAATATADASRLLVVSQSSVTDAAGAMQRLAREWLAFRAARAPTLELHFDGTRRLARAARERLSSEPIALICKEWRLSLPGAGARPHLSGTALVLVNEDTAELAEELFDGGDFQRVVLVGEVPLAADIAAHAVDFADAEAARGAAKALLARYPDITHVIDLAGLCDASRDRDDDPLGRIAFYQMLIAASADLAILCVTKGVQPFRRGAPSLAGAKVAGLVKMLSADYAHVDARTVDIDQSAYETPRQLRRILLQEIGATSRQTEVCYRDGDRYLPELSVAALEAEPNALRVDPDGVYVISGGTNGVGLEIAHLLADTGAKKLVLLGRTPLPPRDVWERAEQQAELTPYVRAKLGALAALEAKLDHLEIAIVPLTDQPALRRCFMKVRATLGPVRGVIHGAAQYSDAAAPGFADKSLEAMRRVLDAKVAGLENLYAVLKSDPLDFFVSFASMTGLMPRVARGAADYAMANAYVEAFTAYQRAAGDTRCRAILWSDWNETGGITRVSAEMAARVARTFDEIGFRTFSNAEGRALFERAMAVDGASTVAIGYVDAEAFAAARPGLLLADRGGRAPVQAEAKPARSIADHIAEWEAEVEAGGAIAAERITDVISLDDIRRLEPALISRIHAVMFGRVRRVQTLARSGPDYRDAITTTVMGVLKLKTVSEVEPLQNYGLDSISATVLATRLEKQLKTEIRPQWLIEFPTIEALARHLAAQASASAPT